MTCPAQIAHPRKARSDPDQPRLRQATGLGCALIAFFLGSVVPDALGLHPLTSG